ncbi:MAG: O-antigen ligase family protein [Candidatus Paceibacterota bacterium]|jgi:O-antigen ligase
MSLFEKVIFYATIFLVPFNIKKFVANPLSIEPLTEFGALFLYLSDILILILLVLWLHKSISQKRLKIKKLTAMIVPFLFFGLFLTLSLFSSKNLTISFYFLVKILLLISFFYYIRLKIKKEELVNIYKIIFIGGIVQSLIALGQYIKQGSLGLRYLGESVIAPNLYGVAKVDFLGQKIVRSYGTFSHPNILAVFLLISICCILWLVLKHGKPICLIGLPIIVLGLTLTFSRTTIFLGLIFVLFFLFYSWLKAKQLKLSQKMVIETASVFFVFTVAFVIIFAPLMIQRFNIQKEEQAVSLRVFYNNAAFNIIKKSPLTGVGLGNFIIKLKESYPGLSSWQYQPVHNIYLLVFSEIGIFGIVAFLSVLFLIFKNCLKSKIYGLDLVVFSGLGVVFLAIGLVDHFFFTINQGILLFWLILGIISNKIISVPEK